MILAFCGNHMPEIPELFLTSEPMLMLSGFLLQFAEERRGISRFIEWNAYSDFIHRRYIKLYPLFALMIVVFYGVGEANCRAIQYLLVFPMWRPMWKVPS